MQKHASRVCSCVWRVCTQHARTQTHIALAASHHINTHCHMQMHTSESTHTEACKHASCSCVCMHTRTHTHTRSQQRTQTHTHTHPGCMEEGSCNMPAVSVRVRVCACKQESSQHICFATQMLVDENNKSYIHNFETVLWSLWREHTVTASTFSVWRGFRLLSVNSVSI